MSYELTERTDQELGVWHPPIMDMEALGPRGKVETFPHIGRSKMELSALHGACRKLPECPPAMCCRIDLTKEQPAYPASSSQQPAKVGSI